MQSYDVFAPFYDAVQGDRAEAAVYLRGLIEKHHPEAQRVLELACGTGSVLKELQADYQVAGVDLSEEMLAIAAAKVPQAQLVAGDMTKVRLGERFDVVLCVYDSINHLPRFEQWESVFDRAHQHLGERGIFIFDINTERRLRWLAQQPPLTSWFENHNLLVLDVRDDADAGVVWEVRIFEHVGGDGYRLRAEEIREVSFPVERIKGALRERFRRVRLYDQQRARPSVRSERLHFLCALGELSNERVRGPSERDPPAMPRRCGRAGIGVLVGGSSARSSCGGDHLGGRATRTRDAAGPRIDEDDDRGHSRAAMRRADRRG